MTIEDTENSQFDSHPINKAIKQMGALSNLLFKTKEYTQQHFELLLKSARFFSIAIPKQFKNDLILLFKNKEFLSNAKDRMHQVMFQVVNKTNNVNETIMQASPKYYIGQGNNHVLVKSIFKNRQWWIQSEKENFDECNFIWT